MPKDLHLTLIAGLLSTFSIDGFTNLLNTHVIEVAQFTSNDLEGWKNKSFKGETKYSLIQENHKFFLQANSMQSASALYKKVKVDIHKTPYLNWSWRVDLPLPPLDEMKKSGDDYAARIYVVFKIGLTPFSTRALNYVWSSNESNDEYWQNAYSEKVVMIPLRSKEDALRIWQNEKVNVKEDLLKHFGKLPKYIDKVAIMTDSDNSNHTAIASYGDIFFSAN